MPGKSRITTQQKYGDRKSSSCPCAVSSGVVVANCVAASVGRSDGMLAGVTEYVRVTETTVIVERSV